VIASYVNRNQGPIQWRAKRAEQVSRAEEAKAKRQALLVSQGRPNTQLRILNNREFQDEALATKTSICTATNAAQIQGQVDFAKLQPLIDERFYDYNLMKLAGCAAYSYFVGIAENHGSLARLAALKDSVKNLKRIGAESLSGNAIRADLDGGHDQVIIKTPRTADAEKDLTHELFVGLFGTNQLREGTATEAGIEQFAMVYGGLKASRPVIARNKEVVSLIDATQADQVPYVLYENIHPATSMAEYVTKCTGADYLRAVVQVCSALDVAERKVGFTHYDLHDENVLVTPIRITGQPDKQLYSMPFTSRSGQVRYVVTSSLTSIIDYGNSTIRYSDGGQPPDVRDIGVDNEGLSNYGILPGPWIFYDIYKFLMFNAFQLMKPRFDKITQRFVASGAPITNPEVFEVISQLFTFFNKEETLADAVLAQRDPYYYMFPKMPANQHLTVDDFLAHVEARFELDKILETTANYPLLSCGQTCLSFAGAFNLVKEQGPPKTFFEFYDRATSLRGYQQSQAYNDLVNSFDYPTARDAYLAKVQADVAELYQNVKALAQKVPTLPVPLTAEAMANARLQDQLATNYEALYRVISTYEDLELWLKVGSAIAVLFSYRDPELINDIQASQTWLLGLDPEIENALAATKKNYQMLREVIKQPGWGRYSKNFPWYVATSGDIVRLQSRFAYDRSQLFKEERLPAALVKAAAAPPAMAPVPAAVAVAAPAPVAAPGVYPRRMQVDRTDSGRINRILTK
jgi:hypothetical protein